MEKELGDICQEIGVRIELSLGKELGKISYDYENLRKIEFS
jgi:hypothetical protein